MVALRDKTVALLRASGEHVTDLGGAEPSPEARVVDVAPHRGGPSSGATFRSQGDFWLITYDGLTVRHKPSRGLVFLAALLREPGREIAAGRSSMPATPAG